ARASGLWEDDESARVVVEEVPAADRRKLAVAEEADQREVAEPIADERHIVVGDAEKRAPRTGAIEVAAEGGPPAPQARRHVVEHRREIVAGRLGVADLELHGLAHPHAPGAGHPPPPPNAGAPL